MKKQFDWKKTMKKGAIMTVYLLFAGILQHLTGDVRFQMIIPLLEMVRNVLKHKYDVLTW